MLENIIKFFKEHFIFHDYKTITMDFCIFRIFIDYRQWYFCLKDEQLSEFWYTEFELTENEKIGDITIKDDVQYRYIPIDSWFRINFSWNIWIRDNRFKIGMLIGMLLMFIIGRII